MLEIVDVQMQEVRLRLEEHGLKVQLTAQAREWLGKTGYDPNFGARPLRRVLQKLVESPLSISLLSGEFRAGDTVVVDVQEEKIVFRKEAAGEQPSIAAMPTQAVMAQEDEPVHGDSQQNS